MALRFYLFSLIFAASISFGLWLLIFFGVNPFQAPAWIVILFYLSLFIFLTSIFGIIGFYLKVWATNREVIFAHILPSLRQSAFVALVIVVIIFLQQLRALNWWVASMLIVAIALIEAFFRSRK